MNKRFETVPATPEPPPAFPVGGMSFDRWLAVIGRSRETGWRWRNGGMIRTVNISGKHFVTAEEDRRFWERAKAGEFAAEVNNPFAR
jgi:hypothetical protein